MLLQESLNEHKGRNLSLDQALNQVGRILHATATVQAGAYGYLEPGIILEDNQHMVLLNAPLVRVLQYCLQQNHSTHPQLALHSPYISPSVAVGDAAVTEDDTFSAAALLYHLLKGDPPYHSTLSGAINGEQPTLPAQLNANGRELMAQALSLRRGPRPETPDRFLKGLRQAHKRKVLYPVAVMAALATVVFAGYHLYQKTAELLDENAAKASTQQAGGGPADTEGNSTDTAAVPPARTTDTRVTTDAGTRSPLKGSASDTAETTDTTPPAPASGSETVPPAATDTAAGPDPSTPAAAPQADAKTTPPTETGTPRDIRPLADSQQLTPAPLAGSTPDTAAAETRTAGTQTEPRSATATPDTDTPTAQAEAAPAASTAAQIAELQAGARQALEQGRIQDQDGKSGALPLLREAHALDKGNAETQQLLEQLLRRHQQAAENLIRLNQFDKAKAELAHADDLMREFVLTDPLPQQVAIETRLEQREQAARLAQDNARKAGQQLEQARAAMKRGRYTALDHRRDNALKYLAPVLAGTPGHTEASQLLIGIVEARQKTLRRLIDRDELDQALLYQKDARTLINRYKLSQFKRSQQTLDQALSQAREAAAARQAQREQLVRPAPRQQAQEQRPRPAPVRQQPAPPPTPEPLLARPARPVQEPALILDPMSPEEARQLELQNGQTVYLETAPPKQQPQGSWEEQSQVTWQPVPQAQPAQPAPAAGRRPVPHPEPQITWLPAEPVSRETRQLPPQQQQQPQQQPQVIWEAAPPAQPARTQRPARPTRQNRAPEPQVVWDQQPPPGWEQPGQAVGGRQVPPQLVPYDPQLPPTVAPVENIPGLMEIPPELINQNLQPQ